jgi:hypothetical protein
MTAKIYDFTRNTSPDEHVMKDWFDFLRLSVCEPLFDMSEEPQVQPDHVRCDPYNHHGLHA